MNSLKRFCCMTMILWAFSMISCKDKGTEPRTTINMEPFIAKAKGAGCSDITNKLYAIDDSMVFWQTEGNCNDANYHYILFGPDTGSIFCIKQASKSGEREYIYDSTYLSLFQTITINLNKPNLGLGSAHSVVNVTL